MCLLMESVQCRGECVDAGEVVVVWVWVCACVRGTLECTPEWGTLSPLVLAIRPVVRTVLAKVIATL